LTAPFLTFGLVGLVGVAWLLALARPATALLALLVYLPLEPALVANLDPASTVVARYGAEAVVYLLFARSLLLPRCGVALRHLTLAVSVLALCCLVSAIANVLDPRVAVLGTRQILRFVLLAVASARLELSDDWLRVAGRALLLLLVAEALFAIAQVAVGRALVAPFIPTEDASWGGIRVREAVAVTWDWNRRVPGTLGRYDRLGLLLAFGLALLTAWRYAGALPRRLGTDLALLAIVMGLVASYSRTSWAGFLGGIAVLAILHRDWRVGAAFAAGVLAVLGLVVASWQDVAASVDYPGQDLRERVLEIFAIERYRGEYTGIGRVYWLAHAPRLLLDAPFFGVGPGMFGGGAAAALKTTAVYDRYDLPFGIWGTEGHVDGNWLSIAIELGVCGLSAYLACLGVALHQATRLVPGNSPYDRALGLGFIAALPGFVLAGATSTAFEIRSYAPFFWVLAGLVVARSDRMRLAPGAAP
jgi:hypothetical protein